MSNLSPGEPTFDLSKSGSKALSFAARVGREAPAGARKAYLRQVVPFLAEAQGGQVERLKAEL